MQASRHTSGTAEDTTAEVDEANRFFFVLSPAALTLG